MKPVAKLWTTVALVALFAAVASPVIAKDANFTGKWAFSGTLGDDPILETMAGVCDITQDDNVLVGSCKGPDGVASIDGSVDGNKIDMRVHHVKTSEGGATGISEFRGVLGDDGIIRGRWKDSAFPDALGTFTGQKVE